MYAFPRQCSTFGTHHTAGVKLCQNYDLSPDQLRWKWESVKLQSLERHRLDVSNIDELKKYVVQEQAKASRPTKKGRLSGLMSVHSGAPGYGPARIPRRLNGGFMSGVKREDVNHPFPIAGSSKILFSQADKVERRECEYFFGANLPCAKPMPL